MLINCKIQGLTDVGQLDSRPGSRPREWTGVLAALLVTVIVSASADARVIGQKKKGIKGRYLQIENGVNFGDYRGALVILERAEITSDKERPVDTESVRQTSDDSLREHLSMSGSFGEIVSAAPLELPSEQPILRLSTKLTLQHGSQAMRFWVGAGAGSSKLHIRIEIIDARSGRKLGFFNGYGSGSGFWSMSGGGVQRMARDDLAESYIKFAEYLAQAVR